MAFEYTKEFWEYLNKLNCGQKDGWGKKIGCAFEGLGVLIAIAFTAFFEAIGALFNKTDDDKARAEIAFMDCVEISMQSAAKVDGWLTALLDGPTMDDDERAIIKLVECMPCDRLIGEIWPKFGARILNDVDGYEYDLLRVALLRCGLTKFTDWDDDTTRVYIAQTPCADIEQLSLDDIAALLQNLFDGHTGDEDERAIIKVVKCLPENKLGQLLQRPGFSKDDFDDEVDGAEWRELEKVFASKGL